jgi:two-component system, OmpR family, sensor histidine kinase CpxA
MHRLFWKIFLSFWITEALVLTMAVILANTGVWRETPSSLQQVQAQMPLIATASVQAFEHGGSPALKPILSDASEDTGARWWLFDPQGKEISGNVVPWWVPQILAQKASNGVPASAVYSTRGTQGQYVLVAEPGMPRVPHIPYRPIVRQLLAGLFISGLTCFLLAHYLAQPILRLRRASQAVAAGDLSARAGAAVGDREDEIGDLVRDFDRMAVRIEALMQSQKQLLRDISHDLRSPLQRLRMAVGLARREATPSTQLDRIEREAIRINELVEQVLTLAKLENADAKLPMSPISLQAVIHDVVADASFEAERLQCSVEISSQADAQVTGNRELLHSAIENVVRNAIHHAEPRTTVKVALTSNDGTAQVYVEDEGPGVPENALNRLFEPFFRVDESRGTTNGFGLGLAIAARAVAVHGGTIRAKNVEPHGLRVEIDLPTVAEAASKTKTAKESL